MDTVHHPRTRAKLFTVCLRIHTHITYTDCVSGVWEDDGIFRLLSPVAFCCGVGVWVCVLFAVCFIYGSHVMHRIYYYVSCKTDGTLDAHHYYGEARLYINAIHPARSAAKCISWCWRPATYTSKIYCEMLRLMVLNKCCGRFGIVHKTLSPHRDWKSFNLLSKLYNYGDNYRDSC